MAIEVTARHMGPSPELQDYARERAERLLEAFPRIEHIHVILNVETHRRHTAEIVVQAKELRAESAETSDNLRASIDLAAEKIERQLRRTREKRVASHRKHGPAPAAPAARGE
jgi:putative sigma-54 modulation protein